MKNQIAVRRSRSEKAWYVADEGRKHFTDTIEQALLQNVTFIHQAAPMQCVWRYNSTGEAVGIRLPDSMGLEILQNISRKAEIIYDPKKRRFHIKDKPKKSISAADYLLLSTDGTAIAAWKKKSITKFTAPRKSGVFNWKINVCRGEDSNLQGLLRVLLRHVRLPISPPRHVNH